MVDLPTDGEIEMSELSYRERVSLDRYRRSRTTDIRDVYGVEGGPVEAIRRLTADERVCAEIALREHPGDEFDPVSVGALVALGWKAAEVDEGWVVVVSPDSQPEGGPVARLEWDTAMGCDGWRVDGESLIGPFDTIGEVRLLCRALKIPLLGLVADDPCQDCDDDRH